MRISIIVPVLNEAANLEALLRPLQPWRQRGHEVVVVDGGSRDGSAERAAPWADQVLNAPRGRARQMNAGAAAAGGEVLWFIHADSQVSPGALDAVRAAIGRGAVWGRFDVRLSGAHPLLRVVGALMNRRSRWSGIATGDQAVFVTREAFAAAGGFPEIPLMEDVALSRKLRGAAPPVCLRQTVVTSSRRWERDGILATVWLMWRLRLAYWRGADPAALARRYYPSGVDQ